MARNEPLSKDLHIRVTPDEVSQIERLRERLQAQLGPLTNVTQRTVFLAALERLEAHLAKLEKDRDRRASGSARADGE